MFKADLAPAVLLFQCAYVIIANVDDGYIYETENMLLCLLEKKITLFDVTCYNYINIL